MNQWSRRRKRIILSIVIFVLVFLVGGPVFFLFYQAPTCNDFKQNGDEVGIDCGGSCQLLCTSDSLPLISKGDPRILKVRENTYEIVALVENPNINGEIYRVGYIFKLYDASSIIPIKVLEGETYVPKGATLAVFEGPFTLEKGVILTRATLEWKKESLIWQINTRQTPEIVIKDLNLSRIDTNPRMDAVIENHSLENISNIDLVAIISDETGSIFAATKTFVEELPVGEKGSVVFTWPEPFNNKPIGINVVIRILPDKSFIR